MVLVDMARDRDYQHVLAPMQQGRAADEEPDGEDPMLAAAGSRLQRAGNDSDASEADNR